MVPRPVFRAAGVVAMLVVLAVILYESSQARGQPGVLELTTNEAYVAHFAVYAVMTFCAMLAVGRASLGNLAVVFLLSVNLGMAMELYQAYEPSRTLSAMDALANAAGAFTGVSAYALLAVLFEPPRRKATKP